MSKIKLIEKCYKIDLSQIDECYMYADIYCYAENLNKAKVELLSKIKYDDMKLNIDKSIVSYTNIPVKRYPEYDKVSHPDFENKMLRYQCFNLLIDKDRRNKLDKILKKREYEYYYIKKNGYYYRDNNKGYTDNRDEAGIYTIDEAVKSAKSCNELILIPIDIHEHNSFINERIEYLKTKMICK